MDSSTPDAASTATTVTLAALVADAAAAIEALDPERFAVVADRPGTVVIDVREPDERRASGTIQGAIHVPRGLLELAADATGPHHHAQLRRDRRTLLYCSNGQRSSLAGASLVALGYADVAHLDGGVTAWEDASLPLEGAVAVMTDAYYEALINAPAHGRNQADDR